MEILDPILNLPYAYIWLPSLVFVFIAGGIFWFTRPLHRLSADASAKGADAIETVTAKNPQDQRYSFRRQGNPVQVYVKTAAEKTNPAVGSVLDRSIGGMRLALFQPVEIGAVLSIRPTNADDIVPWIELEIRSCRPSIEMHDQFEIGCQYVKSPPYSIQLLFG